MKKCLMFLLILYIHWNVGWVWFISRIAEIKICHKCRFIQAKSDLIKFLWCINCTVHFLTAVQHTHTHMYIYIKIRINAYHSNVYEIAFYLIYYVTIYLPYMPIILKRVYGLHMPLSQFFYSYSIVFFLSRSNFVFFLEWQ